jgi:hypothetical protein
MTFRNGLSSLLRPEDSVLVMIDGVPPVSPDMSASLI